MKLKSFFEFVIFFLVISMLASLSSSNFISDCVFDSQTLVTGRNLLQAKKPCPVNFEFLNYTVITSRCKGPNYPPDQCCSAFKDFACPYAEELNQLDNDCATTMFSYINLYGKYPPGLFANQCKDTKEGLTCPALPPVSKADINAAHHVLTSPRLSLTIMAVVLFLTLIKLF